MVDAACASSLGAVNLAMLELAAGRCDLAVTGGLDTFNDIFMYMCFSKTPALSPTGDARPFDAEADGTILGEGLGVLVLKRLDDARRDGDRIYAVIRSIGTLQRRQGAGGLRARAPRGRPRRCSRPIDSAGRRARQRSSWSRPTGPGPGSATRPSWRRSKRSIAAAEPGGPVVCPGVGQVAGRPHQGRRGRGRADQGGAGAASQGLAAHIKVRRPIEPLAGGTSPFYLNTEARPWLPRPCHPRRAAVSAFGFGGSNFHCVLEEADPAKPAVDWDGDVQILAFSADNAAEIDALAARTGKHARLERGPHARAREAARSFRAASGCACFWSRNATKATSPRRARRLEPDWNRCRRPPASTSPTAPPGTPERRRSSRERALSPADSRCFFPAKGPSMSACCASWLAGFRACRRPSPWRMTRAADEQNTRLSDRIYPPTAHDEATRAVTAS